LEISTVAELVRSARNGLSQKEFAQTLGVRQSTVSRYERGKANPPVRVIEQCMRLVHTNDAVNAPTADALAAKIRTELADSNMADIRCALTKLVDHLAQEHAQSPGE